MWPSNQQQWSAVPPASSTSTPQATTPEGQQQGYAFGDQSNAYSYQYQQQQYQLQQYQLQQYQNQMMPEYQQQQYQAPSSYYNNYNSGDVLNQYQNQQVGATNYAAALAQPQYDTLGQVPPPPPPPLPPPPPPPPRQPPKHPSNQRFSCDICKVTVQDQFSFQQHMIGEKHKRQAYLANNGARVQPSTYQCKLCNVNCTTEHSYQQHVKGEKHRKKAAIAATGGPQTIFCNLCNVTCPGQISYDQHLNGEKHKRQVAAANDRNNNAVKVFHCSVCNVSCPNDLSFAHHMNGERHKKKVVFANLVNSNRSRCIPVVNSELKAATAGANLNPEVGQLTAALPQPVHCKVCLISCPNELSYQQHINGEKHRKMVATGGINSNNSTEEQQSVFCDVCRIYCPNELSYQQHVNGEKHCKRVANLNNPSAAQGAGGEFHCRACNVTCTNEYSYHQHVDGKRHKKKVAALGMPYDPSNPSASVRSASLASAPLETGERVQNAMTEPLPQPIADAEEPVVVKEIRPLVSKPIVEEDSEEEGEIDEEGEDVENLYDEFKDNLASSSNLEVSGEQDNEERLKEDKGGDSDIDEMFGGDEDGEIVEEDEKCESSKYENNNPGTDVDDMFGDGEIDEKETPSSHPDQFTQQPSKPDVEDSIEQKHDQNERDDDEMDMFGDGAVDEIAQQRVSCNIEVTGFDQTILEPKEPVKDEGNEQSHDLQDGSDVDEAEMFGGAHISSADDVNNSRKPLAKIQSSDSEGDDAMDMFGESGEGDNQASTPLECGACDNENNGQSPGIKVEETYSMNMLRDSGGDSQIDDKVGNQTSKPMDAETHVTAKLEQPTMLSSGLGFVLDYSPDTSTNGANEDDNKPDSKGFILDYSPAAPVNDAGNDRPESSHAHHDPAPDRQTPPEQAEDDEMDMFGINSSDTSCGRSESSDAHQDPSQSSQTPPEQEEDDEMDMFGGNSSEEEDDNANETSPSNGSQIQESDIIDPKAENGAPMTTADALAAARGRAKMPLKENPAKRAKVSTQKQRYPVKLPQKILHYEVSKRTYYAPVHPDKYWSELRNWDFVRDLNDAMKNSSRSKKRERGPKRSLNETNGEEKSDKTDSLPDVFESVAQYKALWAPLLINEAKAQLLSEVAASQSSAFTSWFQRNEIAMGVSARVELSRTARDHSSAGDSSNSLDPTVVVHIRSCMNGAGIGCPVNKNDVLLFVHHSSIIGRVLRGKVFDTMNDDQTLQNLSRGRLGFIGHSLNHRSRAVDGLLVRVQQKLWRQFASLDELFVIRIGSNVTALREFNALSRADTIPLTKYILDGKTNAMPQKTAQIATNDDEGSEKALSKFDPLDSLPVGFRIFLKSKMNHSQLNAITASASEYGDGGFTLIKGPPGTGKSTTLCAILNALHLRQYQEYYSAIEKIVTGSSGSTHYEELAALNKAAEVKPRILVCAPSNAGIDNVIMKIMSDRFVDGQGAKYSPSIVRVGAGITNPKIQSIGLKQSVDALIEQFSDVTKLENAILTGRQNLKRYQTEIHKLKLRIQAMVDCCPYEISSEWEIRIDEAGFETSGRVLFVNHSTKTTTFDIPPKVRPTERPCTIQKMAHYVSLMKSLTKYVERHNNESSNLEKWITIQNAANAKMESGGVQDESIASQLETQVLNSTHICLSTLGSSGGRAVESANKFKVVVIDEAAQSAEPSTLVALQLGSSHAILVGDPQQLPATIFSVSGRSTKYDRSMFQRLEECGHDVHLLNTQYRMNPVISEFPRHIFYEGMLLDGPNVQQPEFGGPLRSIIRSKFPYVQPFNIFDLDSKEERDGTSLSNKNEAQLVLQLYRTLDRQTDGLVAKSRVAVITPYSQQASLLHRLFNESYGSEYQSRVEISTVDAFQGREAGIVIYSCVRAGGSGSGIGFLSDVQRMNVALTRAKHFLFVIARRRSIMVNPYWRKLVGYARSKSAIIHVPIDKNKQPIKPKALRSLLIKSSSVKKVSFGGISKRVYEVNSKANSNEEEEELFPDLTCLAPMHSSSVHMDASSDGECSA